MIEDPWNKTYKVNLELTAYELGSLIGILAKGGPDISFKLYHKIIKQTESAINKIYEISESKNNNDDKK